MSKIISRIFRTSLLLLAAGAAIFSTRADQPPEILYATAPYTAILNLGATNSVLLANASVCDAAGNFYVTGSFEGTAKFGTNVLGSNGGYAFDDMYVVKYDPAGNVLWARQAGGTGKDFGTAITLDGAGGIYVAGTSDSYPATFGTNILYMLTQSLFVVHYDGNGNLKWVERGGSTGFPGGTVFVNGIAHDAANNVIVAGSFKGSPNFGGNFNGQTGNQTIYLTNHNTAVPTGSQDTYLAKFDAGGNVLWAINPGGPENDYANAVAVDSTGAIYTSGGYTYTNVLGGQTYTNYNEGIFLAKFSGAGDFVWSSNLSDPTNSNPGRGLALAVDGNDRVTLSFQGNNSSQPFAFRGSNYALAFGAINLLAQFDVNGNLFWLKQIALNTGSSSLTVDKQNNIYLGGSFQANVVIYLALLKMNSSGAPLWTNSVPQGGLPVASVDDAGITHVSTTVVGDVGAYFTVGWTNIYPGFGGFGKDALMFVIASNFVAVPPAFVQQPTNMFFQPPYGLTNATLARAWPAPKYYWVMGPTNKLRAQTNFALALGPTGFTNQTTYFVIASNAYGLATSTVVTATANLSFAVSPPTNAYVVTGTTLSLSGSGASASTISYQWRLNGTNLIGANSPTLALSGITAGQAGSYTLVMSNASTVLTSAPPTVVTVLAVGSVDPGYASVGGSAGLLRVANGSFYGVDSYNAYHINSNGSIDTNGFLNPYAAGAYWSDQGASRGPNAIARDPDGKLLLGGGFTMFNTTNFNRLVRMNTNGSLDLSFSVGTGPVDVPDGNAGYYTQVNQVLSLTNGQYLVAGAFNVFSGLARTNLVRLNHDGSVDTSFANHAFRPALSQSTAFFGCIHALTLLPDGKILAGGEFETVDGVTNNDLVRLNPNGTLDPTFTPENLKLPYLGRINALQPLPDGKLLAVGSFYNMTNTAVIRYNTNGVRDTTWLGLLPGQAFSIVGVQSNKFIIGGNSYVKRLNYDGSNDANFDPGTFFSLNGYFTYVLVLEPSGNVMAGGTTYGLRRLLLEPIPVVVPSFSSGSGVAVVNGHMQFSACGGVDGQTVYVQASMNLANWQTVSTNVVTGGCISYIDPQIPAPPNRYYRLNTVP